LEVGSGSFALLALEDRSLRSNKYLKQLACEINRYDRVTAIRIR
jgi:hypothetical protein